MGGDVYFKFIFDKLQFLVQSNPSPWTLKSIMEIECLVLAL